MKEILSDLQELQSQLIFSNDIINSVTISILKANEGKAIFFTIYCKGEQILAQEFFSFHDDEENCAKMIELRKNIKDL